MPRGQKAGLAANGTAIIRNMFGSRHRFPLAASGLPNQALA